MDIEELKTINKNLKKLIIGKIREKEVKKWRAANREKYLEQKRREYLLKKEKKRLMNILLD